MSIEDLKRRAALFVARHVASPAGRLATWSANVLDEEDTRRAYEAFPVGVTVRLVENGCCTASCDPANRDGVWIIRSYTDAGDYYVTRPGSEGLGKFVHGSAMVRLRS